MSPSIASETSWNGLQLSAGSYPRADQRGRILAALALTANVSPKVDQDTLARYYTHLSANVSLPFTAYYPQPLNAEERTQFRCTILELLDPTRHLGDEFDGIFCKVRKGKFEVNLPLIELHVPDESPNFQLIEDYGHWFWNWR
jgi:hypothetical protein